MNPVTVAFAYEESTHELSLLDMTQIPHHVAIIMDGNRRWARTRGIPPVMGHWKGAEVLTKTVRAAADLGVKVLTVYAFSTENWRRTAEEVEMLMHLTCSYLTKRREEMVEEGVKLETIGDLSPLPESVRSVLEETKKATAHCERIQLVLALNYGGRDDIRRATLAIIDDYTTGKLKKDDLSEKVFATYLDTAQWGDPELLIRTSGEQRLSNFLLWQISYAEVYVTDVLWPEFNEKELLRAFLDFQKRQKREGS